MKRNKKSHIYQKLLLLLSSGDPVPVDVLKEKLKDEMHGYRISTRIYEIKCMGGVVRVTKEGRKVLTYQVMNASTMRTYLRRIGLQVPEVNNEESSSKKCEASIGV